MLGNYLQPTTSADVIFQMHFLLVKGQKVHCNLITVTLDPPKIYNRLLKKDYLIKLDEKFHPSRTCLTLCMLCNFSSFFVVFDFFQNHFFQNILS